MGTFDVILELVRLEARLGYTALQASVWDRYDRCCHERRNCRPKHKGRLS